MTARGVRDCGLIQGRSNAVGAPGNSQSLANDSSWLFGVERAVVSPAAILIGYLKTYVWRQW